MFEIIVGLAVIGVLLWLINTYIPMNPKIKKILNTVVIIAIIIWLLNVFGIINFLKKIPVPHVSSPSINMIG